MSLEEVKTSRSSKKRRVTILINKLKGALQYGDGNSSVLKSSLEVEMDNLSDLHLQVEELEEIDSQYLERINREYSEVMESFRRSEGQDAEIEKQKKISAINRKIDRSFFNVQTLTDRLNKSLSLTDLSRSDVLGLGVDSSLLSEEISQLLECVASLGKLTEVGELESRVDGVLTNTEKVKRDAAVQIKASETSSSESRLRSSSIEAAEITHLKELQVSPSLRPEADAFTPSSAPGPTLSLVTATQSRPSFPTVGATGGQRDPLASRIDASSSSLTVLTGASSDPVLSPASYGLTSAVSGASGVQDLGLSIQSLSNMSLSDDSTRPDTICLPSGYPSSVSFTGSSSMPRPFNPPLEYTSSMSHCGSLAMHAPFHHPSGCSSAASLPGTAFSSVPYHSFSQYSSSVVCATRSQESRGIMSVMSSNPLSLPGASAYPPFNYPSGYPWSVAGAPGMQYGKRDTYSSVPGPSSLAIPSSSSRAAPFSQSSGYYPGPLTVNQPDILHTKRPSLPTFSGDRADWPEFRCVWTALAESQYSNKVQLAMELKRSCKGKAADRVRHIYVTHDYAYEEIWERLREEYDDPGLCSQEAINQLMSLRPVSDHDFEGLVKVIDTVDGIFNQLRELHQLCAIHAVDVDRVSANLPATTRMEWLRLYGSLSSAEKMAPFGAFVMFLRRERAAVARLAESMPSQKRTFKRASAHLGQGEDQGKPSANPGSRKKCALQHDGHLTKDCEMFLDMAIPERYVALRKSRRCYNCFEPHMRDKCTAPACKECGKSHHKLLCTAQQTDTRTDHSSSHLASAGAMALYPICRAMVKGSLHPVTVLLDGGSNASYITTRCAQRLRLKILDRVTLSVTTVGGKDRDYRSAIYEADLRTIEGKTVKVTMYELPKITGKIARLDRPVIEELFPDFDSDALRRTTEEVDLLIGTDYFGLHPKEELGKAGEHLSVMKGQLGVCLIGTHPLFKEADQLKGEVPRTLHLSELRIQKVLPDSSTSISNEIQDFHRDGEFIEKEELDAKNLPDSQIHDLAETLIASEPEQLSDNIHSNNAPDLDTTPITSTQSQPSLPDNFLEEVIPTKFDAVSDNNDQNVLSNSETDIVTDEVTSELSEKISEESSKSEELSRLTSPSEIKLHEIDEDNAKMSAIPTLYKWLAPIGCWFKGVDPRVVDLIYWRNVKKTCVVFGTMLTVLICLAICSLVSVVAYLSLALLTVCFSFVIYKRIMGAVQKSSDGHPFKQLLENG